MLTKVGVHALGREKSRREKGSDREAEARLNIGLSEEAMARRRGVQSTVRSPWTCIVFGDAYMQLPRRAFQWRTLVAHKRHMASMPALCVSMFCQNVLHRTTRLPRFVAMALRSLRMLKPLWVYVIGDWRSALTVLLFLHKAVSRQQQMIALSSR